MKTNAITILMIVTLVGPAQSQTRPLQKNTRVEELIRSRVADRKIAMAKYVPKILELQKEINRNAAVFLIPVRTNKDAGPYLNARLNWFDVVNNANAKKANEKYLASLGPNKISKLLIPANVKDKLDLLGSDSFKKAAEIDLKSVDFSWLKELQKFDFWNDEENSPLAYMDTFDFTSYPIPDYASLFTWARLRLIKGIQEKNVKAAEDEVIHLGRLAHSTENIVGAATSVALFKLIASFAKGKETEFKVDLNLYKNAKLYFFSLSKALGNPINDPQVFDQLTQSPFGPGFCAVMREVGANFFMDKTLLETDLKEIYSKYEVLLKSKMPCRLRHVRSAWMGNPKYVIHYKSFSTLSVEARKQASEIIKPSLSAEDFQILINETSSARWPQYYGYFLALSFKPESMFSDLGVK